MDSQHKSFEILPVSYDRSGIELEGLIFKPTNIKQALPGVVFVHGHDSNAWKSSWFGYQLCCAGFAAFLPTQLGYKFSGGLPDFCGPETIQGVLAGVEIFKEQSFVDPTRLGIWGISRGATVAALVSAERPSYFRATVLQSGIYDFPAYMSNPRNEGIATAILTETKGTRNELLERSATEKVNDLTSNYLILHGDHDERVPVAQATLLNSALTSAGKAHTLVLVPHGKHFITPDTISNYTVPFLSSHLHAKQS